MSLHPLYPREQQTAAQEAQLQKCSPCPPPPLPRLTRLFSGLVRMLQSEVVLQAFVVTLRRAIDTSTTKSRYFTEGQVHKVLYLMALAVRETQVETKSAWVEKARGAGLIDLAQRVGDMTSLPQHVRSLASWVVRASGGEAMEVEAEQPNTQEEVKRKAKAKEAAAARKAKILAQMNAAQKTFAAENSAVLAGMGEDKAELIRQESLAALAVSLGPSQTSRSSTTSSYTCILCQEEGTVGTGAALVMAAYIQKTTVMRQDDQPSWEGPPSPAPLHHLLVGRQCGPHLSTCGHVMHATCYQKFFDSLVQKERHNEINLMGKIQNFDVSVGEFTCPICERLSNTVMPLIPPVTALRAKQSSVPTPEIGLNAFITALAATAESWHLKEDKEDCPALPRIELKTTLEEQVTLVPSLLPPQAAMHGRHFAQCFQTTQENDCFPLMDDITGMMNAFSLAAFTTSLELNPFEEDYKVSKARERVTIPQVPLVTLQTVALTLSSLERTLWVEERPLLGSLNPRDEDLVRYMVRLVATFPSSYSKPPGSANMRELLRKMKNFYKLRSLQVATKL